MDPSDCKAGPPGQYVSRASVTFDQLIRERRVSQTEVAKAIGVEPPTVSDWRHAKKRPWGPNPARIEQWSRDVDPETGELGEPRIPRDDWFPEVAEVASRTM